MKANDNPHRSSRIALVDPVHKVGYSRANRRGCEYKEDPVVQEAIDQHGPSGAVGLCSRLFGGVVKAVLPK